MLKNYFKIAWRNLTQHKVFTFINIFGLTAGLTVCLMIFLFIANEYSVDGFHSNARNIYRVVRGYDPSKPPAPSVSALYAGALLNDFPGEIKQATRVMPNGSALVAYGNRSFNQRDVNWVDSNFFTVFSFPLLKGNPATVLKEPNSVVLTETTAKKYFGNEDPMGKTLTIDKGFKAMVTGIAKDVPANSTLSFDMVISISSIDKKEFMKTWTNNGVFTYVLLGEHTGKVNVEKRLPAFMEKYMGGEMRKSGFHFVLSLSPLRDIYFENASSYDMLKHGDKKVVYVFLSIAALILLIACINFMNLSTIRAVERSKEVGLRKVMGAMRRTLIEQFLGESLLLAVISCILSLALLQSLMPVYNWLLGYTLAVPYNAWYLYAFLGGAAIAVGLLAGLYPALILSGFSPIEGLRGTARFRTSPERGTTLWAKFFRLGKGGSYFRQVLVVVQFSISVFLITGTIIIARQMSYVKNKDLGYDQEQTLVVPLHNNDIFSHLNAFRQELRSNSNIVSVCTMSGEPGGYFDEYLFDVEGQSHPWKAKTEFADFEYVNTLGLKLIAGRDLSAQYPTDTLSAVLINRTAAASLGFTPETAIGKRIRNTMLDSTRRKVVGVVEDFNYSSLKQKIEPLVISPNSDRWVALVRLKPGNLPKNIGIVKAAYAKAAPAYPCEYSFLDQKFDQLYRSDLRQQNILSIFSCLAILIACLGLFGLTSFTVVKRTREIGVRKVLGSSVQNIILLLSKELLKPVLVATLIAIPVAYAVMHTWLQNFAYRTGMPWWIFVLSAIITVAISLCTLTFKAAKAAVANPTNSLRSE